MKNIISKLYSALAIFALLFATSCNEEIYVDETIATAPEIASFSPSSAAVGSKIYITGESLNNVKSAKIGGKEVTIFECVSNTSLTLLADIEGASGAITLTNANGSVTSTEKFTYEYSTPEINADCQVNIEMGEKMLIMGKNLAATTAVYFKPATGTDEKLYEAEIVSKNNTEILVTVPYVSADDAELVLASYNGETSTEIATAHAVVIKRDKPEIDAFNLAEATVGRTVTITGSFMNKISWVELGGQKANVSVQTEDTFSFTVPANSSYVDGDNADQKVEVFYFDGYESVVLSDSFCVYVPFVHYWQDVLTYCQSRDAESLSSFFAPEKGIVYANSDWQSLDVTAVELNGAVSGSPLGSNYPYGVTKEQYDAVPPYFFFSCMNAGTICPYSPNNSNSQLKNFYGTTSSDSSITGKSSWYGTPSLAFKWIDPNGTVAAEKELYAKVVAGEIEDISEVNFPIDYTNKLVGGVAVSSVSAAPNDTVWANGVFTDYYPTGSKAGTNLSYDCDIVLMVFYYTYDKADTVTGSSAALDKVKRIGFLHIKHIEYTYDSNGYPKATSFLYNCYWQKYDYDYSKVVL